MDLTQHPQRLVCHQSNAIKEIQGMVGRAAALLRIGVRRSTRDESVGFGPQCAAASILLLYVRVTPARKCLVQKSTFMPSGVIAERVPSAVHECARAAY